MTNQRSGHLTGFLIAVKTITIYNHQRC